VKKQGRRDLQQQHREAEIMAATATENPNKQTTHMQQSAMWATHRSGTKGNRREDKRIQSQEQQWQRWPTGLCFDARQGLLLTS